MTSVDWSAVEADDFAVPEGHPMADLTPALAEMLRSTDPLIRDKLGCSILAIWIERGYLSHDQQIALGDDMAKRFSDAEVQARTFAPLILAEIAAQGVVEDRWVAAFEDWYAAEVDLRGNDPAMGWLHAVAHGADLLGQLGLTATVDPQRMLRLAGVRLTAPTDYVWRDQEEDRLALAIARTLTRDNLGPEASTSWLDAVEAMLAGAPNDSIPPNVSNTARTLRSLYVLMDTGARMPGQELARIPRHAPAVKARLVAVLHHTTPWMW